MNCVICGKEIGENYLKRGKTTCSKSCAISLALKQKWSDPAYREKMNKIFNSADFKNKVSIGTKEGQKRNNTSEKLSVLSKQMWQNPEHRAKVSASVKKTLSENPDIVKQRAIKLKQTLSTEESKKKHSEASKQMWSNPEFKQKMGEIQKEAQNKDYLKLQKSINFKLFWKNNKEIHRKKISNALKKVWADESFRNKMQDMFQSEEYREKVSEGLKDIINSEEYKKNKSDAFKRMWSNPEYKEKMRKIIKKIQNLEETKQKIYNTKRKNNSFNTSKPEDETYNILKEIFNDVKTQYKEDRYPYNCDFYIPSLDLFIECNYHWTHGIEPYNPLNEEHQKIVESWKNKNKKFYDNAINVWTVKDVQKIECAYQNKLNYIVFYSFDEFLEWVG